jgi:hypothetical protein
MTNGPPFRPFPCFQKFLTLDCRLQLPLRLEDIDGDDISTLRYAPWSKETDTKEIDGLWMDEKDIS